MLADILTLGAGAAVGFFVGDIVFALVALELRDRRRDARRPTR
jgi:hypothetical protein